MEPNLVVTYDPTHHSRAKAEVEQLLEGRGVHFIESGYEGVFLVHADSDTKEIVKSLGERFADEPFRFKYTFRWVPLEKWLPLEKADTEVAKFNSRIAPDESWKLDIAKRGNDRNLADLIERFAKNIDKPKVDLKNAQKIVKVEIVGDSAGVALLDKSEYLNAAKR